MNKPNWLKSSSFWIIRRFVRDYAIKYSFPQVAMQGLFLRITNNISCTPLVHYEREVGSSGYTIKKLLRQYSSDLGFSVKLLNIILAVGLFITFLSVLGAIALLIYRIVDPVGSVGFAGLICLFSFYTGLILNGIGILGNYLGRLYRGQTADPQFVVRETRNINTELP